MNSKKQVIQVETDKELLKKYWVIWMISRNLVDIPTRREWLDAMSWMFLEYRYVEFRFKDGTRWELGDIDEIFGDDPDVRWMHDYWDSDESGVEPKRTSKKFERLRVISAFLKLKHPNLRKHLDA